MALDLTSAQLNAAHRRDVYGVVYALTGTLQSLVSGIPDVTFYWSTKELASGGPVAGYSDGWEPYLALPQEITEELPMMPGEVPPLHNIDILVRNLPFQTCESVLTAITDGMWQWEGTDATLYAAYQRRGQTAAEIPQGDWFILRKKGQLGGPQNVGMDGFTSPLASREQVRRQQIEVREVTSGDFPDADPREYGKVIATVYGAPDSWVRARRTDAGIFGLVTDSVVSGEQDYVWVSNDAGFDMSGLVGKEVYLHRADHILTVDHIGGSDESLAAVYFTETIDVNIPQGAVLQERKTGDYSFALLNQKGNNGINLNVRVVGFELLDGRIIPLDVSSWSFNCVSDANGKGLLGSPSLNPSRIDIKILDAVQPPVIIPRLNLPSDSGAEVIQQPETTVTQQPTFETDQTMEATKDNWPTGPGAAGAAYDGNNNTSYGIAQGDSVTFTFPGVTGGFDNDDTTVSTLTFTSAGAFTVTDGLLETYATVTGAKGTYTIHLGSPAAFNQSVKFIGGLYGGQVYEVQWTHELSKAISINQINSTMVDTSDVVVAGTGEIGYDMLPVKGLVAKVDSAHGTYRSKALPNRVFEDVQMRFLGESLSEQSAWENETTYSSAQARYLAEGLALHFVIDRQFSWSELEADLALASRSYAYYGPSGHELHYIEGPDTLAAIAPIASFRLPGCPNPNAVQSPDSPMMERTPLSQLLNTVRIYHTRNWLMPRSADLEEKYDSFTEASSDEALARFGRRIDGDTPVLAWPISRGANWSPPSGWGPSGYSGGTHAAAIAQFLADRYASGATRFTFDTAGEVVGVQRSDIVNVAYAVAAGVYRNVPCEVEMVKQLPNDVNKYTITCRSIGTPQKGLTPNYIWADLFTSTADSWTDRITGVYDRWEQYFGVQ